MIAGTARAVKAAAPVLADGLAELPDDFCIAVEFGPQIRVYALLKHADAVTLCNLRQIELLRRIELRVLEGG